MSASGAVAVVSGDGRERRQYERFALDLEIIAWSNRDPRTKLYGRTLNISQGGLLFTSIANFRIGQIIAVCLEYEHVCRLEKKGQVLRKVATNPIEGSNSEVELNLHTYAFQFTTPMQSMEVQNFVHGLPRPSATLEHRL
ncbi:MAG: PilZ domain-containing protein [Leptospiraceae bacterium]|nr:PilZ domain-containing protein [Leptospiraceae bacterium]